MTDTRGEAIEPGHLYASALAVASNSLMNLGTSLILMALGFVLVPLTIRAFGNELYGILSVTFLVLGQLGWLDLGLSRATGKFVAEALDRDQPEEAAAWCRTALWTQGAIGSGGAIIVWVLAPLLVSGLRVSPAHVHVAVQVLRIFALSVPLTLMTSSLTGGLQASQRFLAINLINVLGAVWTYAAYGIGILTGGNLLLVVYGLLAWRVINLVLLFLCARRALPALGKLRLSPSTGDYRARLGRMLRFGGWVTVSAVAGPLLLYFDQWLIGLLLGVGLLPYYTVPLNLLARLSIFPASMTSTLFPAFSALSARGHWDEVTRYLFTSARYLLLLTAPVLVMLVVWGPAFLSRWLGPAFGARAGAAFQILALGTAAGLLAPTVGALLEGAGRPDLLAKIYVAEVPVNLLLVWWCTQTWGLVGAAASYSARALIETAALWTVALIALPIRRGKLGAERLKRLFLLLPAAAAVLPLLSVASTAPAAAGLGTTLVLGLYTLAVLVWVVDADDRRLLAQLLHRFSSFGSTARRPDEGT